MSKTKAKPAAAEADARLAALAEENRLLRECLDPFADFAVRADGGYVTPLADSEEIGVAWEVARGPRGERLTLGHARAARKLRDALPRPAAPEEVKADA